MGTLSEHNPSIWVQDTAAPAYPPVPDGLDVDVAVIGGGVAGLSAALALQDAGHGVAVLEAGRVASGVTGYSTAKVTSQHSSIYHRLARTFGEDAARTYGASQQAGLAQTARWVTDHDIDCRFGRAPAHVYTTSADFVDELREEADVARRIGLPATFTTEVDLPFAVRGAVRFDDQAMFHPRRYCLGLADAIVRGGGHVAEHTRAVGVRRGDRLEVQTTTGAPVRARHVVVATQLPFLDRGAFFAKCHPERSYCVAVAIDPPHTTGMYISAGSPTRSVRPYATDEPGVLIVGGEGHKVGQDPDTTRRYDALEAWAGEHYQVTSVVARWSAQDYMPQDGIPYVGRLSRVDDRVLVATGFQKWGFTTAAAAGLVLRDLVGGVANPWAPLLDAKRLTPAASARTFLEENLDVGVHFAADRLKTLRPRPADELAPGEGGIATHRGHKVAAYRDEEGQLHAVSPVCRHLGCLVSFNTAERSWDCPCHGSRFDVDGRVIQGPAVRDLPRRDDGDDAA